jgi:hypothetical protein
MDRSPTRARYPVECILFEGSCHGKFGQCPAAASPRLAAGFGVVCALLILIVALSITMLGRINQGTDGIINDNFRTIEAASTVQDEVNNIAIALRNVMLSNDAADRQKQVEVVMASRAMVGDIWTSTRRWKARSPNRWRWGRTWKPGG